ncbi:DNA polymerase III subunit beta [Bacteroides neonati]|uniref:DNA polymerase III subunit beta n=1 Tax=Bacteroides neonati TaxID=1347393 RepID=UPI0004AE9882|nr:DNA polymerase III subunit beta [Bacteroides neonati]
MKITFLKSELYSKLKSIIRVIQPKNSLPAYDNFLFEPQEGGGVLITAGEEGGRITTIVKCSITLGEVVPSFFINAKTLLEGLKEIPEQPLVFDVIPSEKYVEVCVRYSNGKFNLVGDHGNGYPQISKESSDEPFTLKVDDFIYCMRQVQICCANDELRPVMNGVYVEKDSNTVTYVASDGVMLGMAVSKIENEKGRSSFILPSKFAKILSAIIPPACEEVKVTVGVSTIDFEFDCYIITCRIIEGRYPNYRAVIPSNNNKTAIINKVELVSALKRVSVFCAASTSLVVMEYKRGTLTLTGKNTDLSTSAEELVSVSSYLGADIKIGFKYTALIEILESIPSNEVSISMLEHSKASLIRPAEGGECELTYLIMPLVINC